MKERHSNVLRVAIHEHQLHAFPPRDVLRHVLEEQVRVEDSGRGQLVQLGDRGEVQLGQLLVGRLHVRRAGHQQPQMFPQPVAACVVIIRLMVRIMMVGVGERSGKGGGVSWM